MALNEITEVNDTNQLLVFIRTVDENYTVYEELLKLSSLHGSKKGIDICNNIVSLVNDYGGFEKCANVVTGCARAMVGRRSGLIGILKESGLPNIPSHHSPRSTMCQPFPHE